ncbi:MAG TPA: hypothetical protein VFU31_00590 [Candidatus Binatia bacterium]|nr:hypothetical protein [Candidatus Binatia bacterium]
MKQLITTAIAAFAISTILTLPTGCAWSRKNPTGAMEVAKQVATSVTREVLIAEPQLAPKFDRARVELAVLSTNSVIAASSVIDIINRLPADKLTTRSARISVDGLTLTIALTGNPALPAQTTEDLRPIVIGLEQGVGIGKAQAGL